MSRALGVPYVVSCLECHLLAFWLVALAAKWRQGKCALSSLHVHPDSPAGVLDVFVMNCRAGGRGVALGDFGAFYAENKS